MGSGIGGLGQEAIAFGADKVHIADDPLLENYDSDAYTLVATDLCQKILPSIVLLGQTDIGLDLAPRLAGRLGGGLSMDCIELAIDPETKLLIQTKPVFGGNALATMISRTARPQMATTRSGSMVPADRNGSRQGEVIALEAPVDPSMVKAKVIQRVKEEVEGIRLEDAEVVVCGGRGIGSAENFEAIWELARVLSGTAGGTRAACEGEWLPMMLQIGQTGKIVSPKLYIAVALSGAMQHIAGCSGSKCIVAINKDPEANIFKIAHYGIVSDYKEVLPSLTDKLKELLAK
jgi:electron transfer flavoprotein alpha subunit